LDPIFGVSGKVITSLSSSNSLVYSALVEGDGKILVAGTCVDSANSSGVVCAARYNGSGALDLSFGNEGKLVTAVLGNVRAIAMQTVQNEPRYVLAGACRLSNQLEICILRVTTLGTLDVAFGTAGVTVLPAGLGDSTATSAVAQGDGKIVIGGGCYAQTSENMCLARVRGGPNHGAGCTLNADLNNQVAGNDGILAIRYLLGYTGDALTDGALGANPGRTAQQIESHLEQLKTDGKLDIDGDGEANALTDGLLILRAMLGLSDDALIAGARNTAHPNVRDAKQILTWIESTHGVACLP
jgi:uncharacterized delta-60 repeat protein